FFQLGGYLGFEFLHAESGRLDGTCHRERDEAGGTDADRPRDFRSIDDADLQLVVGAKEGGRGRRGRGSLCEQTWGQGKRQDNSEKCFCHRGSSLRRAVKGTFSLPLTRPASLLAVGPPSPFGRGNSETQALSISTATDRCNKVTDNTSRSRCR